MDEQCIRLTISGTDENGNISLTTRGTICDIPGGWVIEYEETNPDDLSRTHTQLLCTDGRVTVTRAGTMVSTMVFDAQETFIGDYPTPVGNFQLRIFATDVEIKRRGLMGHIRVAYQISLSTALSPNEEVAMRTMDIRFAPCRAS